MTGLAAYIENKPYAILARAKDDDLAEGIKAVSAGEKRSKDTAAEGFRRCLPTSRADAS